MRSLNLVYLDVVLFHLQKNKGKVEEGSPFVLGN